MLRDALMELRAESAAAVPSGSPEANAIPGTNSTLEPETAPEVENLATPVEQPTVARPGEYLIGSVQIATVAFVGIMIIGVVSAGFYLVGRGNKQDPAKPAPAAVASLTVVSKPLSVAAAKTPVEAKPEPAQQMAKPEFRKMYLQLMSVEIGVAEVMASGLRQKGVSAMVSPGVTEHVARLLVGPLPSDAAEVAKVRAQVETLGFRPFSRLFTEADFLPPPPPPPSTPKVSDPLNTAEKDSQEQ